MLLAAMRMQVLLAHVSVSLPEPLIVVPPNKKALAPAGTLPLIVYCDQMRALCGCRAVLVAHASVAHAWNAF